MCGSVGMFVGCAALSVCPRNVARELAPATTSYRSPFQGWENRASVRSSPRRIFSAEDAGVPPIAPELVPVAGHPDVQGLPPEQFRTILLQHLYRYLDFTVALESMVVNRTVLGIANGSVGGELPRQMRADAYRIYCDEAYHALFSADLRQQIEDVTGQPARLPRQPYFLSRFDALLAGVDADLRPLAELLFVIVSETLISATLTDYQSRSDMAVSVRSAIRDHAVDEGRHHVYFASLLRQLWPQLSAAEQRFAGRLVPDLIAVFLDPDVAGTRADLISCGLPTEQADRVLTECFAPERLYEQRQNMARQTLQYFLELGAFDENQPQQRLFEEGLIAG